MFVNDQFTLVEKVLCRNNGHQLKHSELKAYLLPYDYVGYINTNVFLFAVVCLKEYLPNIKNTRFLFKKIF